MNYICSKYYKPAKLILHIGISGGSIVNDARQGGSTIDNMGADFEFGFSMHPSAKAVNHLWKTVEYNLRVKQQGDYNDYPDS